jgi:hypothetical protein
LSASKAKTPDDGETDGARRRSLAPDSGEARHDVEGADEWETAGMRST